MKSRVTLALSPTAARRLDVAARAAGKPRSQVAEQLLLAGLRARGLDSLERMAADFFGPAGSPAEAAEREAWQRLSVEAFDAGD